MLSRFVRIARWAFFPAVLLACTAAAETKNGFNLEQALIPADQIHRGGPPRDGIPSLEYPEFIPATEAGYLRAADRVLGIAVNGWARAYPVRILNFHEIVNDVVAGQRVVITYCPLCLSGMAFRPAVDGRELEFGVSGLLYNSDVLLYDRQTESLWSQISRTAISGPLKGQQLDVLPLAHTTWRDWQERHPDTLVLSMNTGHLRDYRSDPYRDYRTGGQLYFPVSAESRKYSRKSMTLGLEIDGEFKAYPFAELKKSPPSFIDTFQGRTFEVRYDDKNKSATIIAENGEELPTLIAYWFAWFAFHPETEIFEASRE